MNRCPLRCSEESTTPPTWGHHSNPAGRSATPSNPAIRNLQGRSHTSLLGFEEQVGPQPSLVCYPHNGALPDRSCVRLSQCPLAVAALHLLHSVLPPPVAWRLFGATVGATPCLRELSAFACVADDSVDGARHPIGSFMWGCVARQPNAVQRHALHAVPHRALHAVPHCAWLCWPPNTTPLI